VIDSTPKELTAPLPKTTSQYKNKAFPGRSGSVSNGSTAGSANPNKRRVSKKRF